VFDETYETLAKEQYEGWGREKYVGRLAGWKRVVQRIVATPKLSLPPATVLELGCGNGMAAYLFAQRGYHVSGVDISPSAIVWAEQRFRSERLHGAFCVGDICQMPWYQDGQFDLVVDGNCLHCVIGESRQAAISEAFRVTKPGGYFLLSSMCGRPRSLEARSAFVPHERCILKDGKPHRYLQSRVGLLQELMRAGFDVRWHSVRRNPWWNHLTAFAQKPGDQSTRGQRV
jgi:SAM-dependent methyltransferase